MHSVTRLDTCIHLCCEMSLMCCSSSVLSTPSGTPAAFRPTPAAPPQNNAALVPMHSMPPRSPPVHSLRLPAGSRLRGVCSSRGHSLGCQWEVQRRQVAPLVALLSHVDECSTTAGNTPTHPLISLEIYMNQRFLTLVQLFGCQVYCGGPNYPREQAVSRDAV